MPTISVTPGPAGSYVAFSSLAANAKFQFGGVYFSKKNDSSAFDLSNGALQPVLPDQQVLVASVSWDVTEYTYDDVGTGNAFFDPDHAAWVKVEGGAIFVADGLFYDNGTVPPVRSIAKATVVNIDD